ncbi:hypothetical protein ACFP9V_01980 [Deinococcus radiopugnans]|uniref:hypothetical protein n=1 Tax=Deinococcus radiopugnans TaxID=57497 RepID=UPI0036163852
MSQTLNTESILALAPDAGSAANARKLATPGKWPSLNALEGVLWGSVRAAARRRT